jgi:hypothetical protein
MILILNIAMIRSWAEYDSLFVLQDGLEGMMCMNETGGKPAKCKARGKMLISELYCGTSGIEKHLRWCYLPRHTVGDLRV